MSAPEEDRIDWWCVYRDGSLTHLAGANPGTPYTACGLDAGLMRSELHDPEHAARGIVDDVMELDADCLTWNSTRRQEWDARVQRALREIA